MRLLRWWTLLFCLVSRVIGGEFRTITGDVYVGEVSAADADGLIVRQQSGIFSPRVDWAKLDEATLKSLATPVLGGLLNRCWNPRPRKSLVRRLEKLMSASPTASPDLRPTLLARGSMRP